MRLFGTLTSPFVRRVRVAALELGVAAELVDTSTPEGQARLRAVSPIGKVPVAEFDGELIFDSREIVEAMLASRGSGPIRPLGGASERNFVVALDEALSAAIRLFYLRREGVSVEPIPSMVKERERVRTIMTWLDGQVHAGGVTAASSFGVAELALVTGLEWMRYRDAYAVDAHPRLLAVHAGHAGRASLRATAPP